MEVVGVLQIVSLQVHIRRSVNFIILSIKQNDADGGIDSESDMICLRK
jgi:hypothetical protein